MKKAVSAIVRWSVIVLCALVFGFNLYSANAGALIGNRLPMPFGYGAAVVLSGSMEPALGVGDLVFVKEAGRIEKGSIVVFEDRGDLVTHRVIEVREGSVITKGDANNTQDDPVEMEDIKGTVIGSLRGAGRIVEAIKSPVGTALFALLAVALVELPVLRKKRTDQRRQEAIKEQIRKLKEEL